MDAATNRPSAQTPAGCSTSCFCIQHKCAATPNCTIEKAAGVGQAGSHTSGMQGHDTPWAGPQLWATALREERSYYDHDLAAKVTKWARRDFEEFGFEPLRVPRPPLPPQPPPPPPDPVLPDARCVERGKLDRAEAELRVRQLLKWMAFCSVARNHDDHGNVDDPYCQRGLPHWHLNGLNHKERLSIDAGDQMASHNNSFIYRAGSRIAHFKDVNKGELTLPSGEQIEVIVKRANEHAVCAKLTGVPTPTWQDLVYLEYLRGMCGVPELMGAFVVPSHVAGRKEPVLWYAARRAGSVITDAQARGNSSVVLSLEYRKLAIRQPLALARTMIHMFRVMSELGGAFLADLHPNQFTVAQHPGGAIEMFMIDSALFVEGPMVRHQLLRQLPKLNMASTEPFQVECRSQSFCPLTANFAMLEGIWKKHSCRMDLLKTACCHPQADAHNAPQPTVTCQQRPFPSPSDDIDAHSRCAWVGRQIHLTDLLTEPYLLPMVSHEPAVRALVEELRKKAPDDVRFSEALGKLTAKDLRTSQPYMT